MDGDVREYPYRPSWRAIIFSALWFGLCAAFLGSEAAHNDQGLLINGIIGLGPGGATVFYWILTALSAGFVVISAFLAYHRLTFQQQLVFGPAVMTVPVSRWSRETQRIEYRSIEALSKTAVYGQQFLYITHPGGKYTLSMAMLPSKAVFAQISELLAARVRQAHPERFDPPPLVR
jgi:hypothetical protein